MKICFYSPYVPKHTGGGEKYFFDAARILAEDHEVFVGISEEDFDERKIREKYQHFLDTSLEKIRFISTPLGTSKSFLEKILWTSKFQVMYYTTDGSLFFSLAGKNILHIQVPFTDSKTSFVERMKLMNWGVKNANSQFTQKVVSKAWQTSVPFVHYPMIEAAKKSAPKEKIILNVGRFFRQLHSKRQDVLVHIFQELRKKHSHEMHDWKLVLIGGVEDQSYAQEVMRAAAGAPVEILHHVDRNELNDWYARASIYWHATGFEVDEEKHPEKVEHFGISTAEAMTYGCVPIVVGKGGQKEVAGGELQKFLWQTKIECMEKTLPFLQNPELVRRTGQSAKEYAQKFSEASFAVMLKKMIGAS